VLVGRQEPVTAALAVIPNTAGLVVARAVERLEPVELVERRPPGLGARQPQPVQPVVILNSRDRAAAAAVHRQAAMVLTLAQAEFLRAAAAAVVERMP
jgi:hypothetical protein